MFCCLRGRWNEPETCRPNIHVRSWTDQFFTFPADIFCDSQLNEEIEQWQSFSTFLKNDEIQSMNRRNLLSCCVYLVSTKGSWGVFLWTPDRILTNRRKCLCTCRIHAGSEYLSCQKLWGFPTFWSKWYILQNGTFTFVAWIWGLSQYRCRLLTCTQFIPWSYF